MCDITLLKLFQEAFSAIVTMEFPLNNWGPWGSSVYIFNESTHSKLCVHVMANSVLITTLTTWALGATH